MSLFLDSDIFNWLISLGLLKSNTSVRQTSNNKCELDQNTSLQFATGIIFSKIIDKVLKLQTGSGKDLSLISNLDSLKSANTPAAKLYNWNIITDALKKFNIQVESDVKSLIVAGDLDLINEILREIYRIYGNSISLSISPGTIDNTRTLTETKKNTENSPKSKGPSKKIKPNVLGVSTSKSRDNGSVVAGQTTDTTIHRDKDKFHGDVTIDISKVNPDKDPSQTNSALEFFIITLSRHLSLTPKQAVSLLTNGNKYLAHVLAKGVKGIFEPIIFWYQDVYTNSNHLLDLIQNDKTYNALTFSQAALKPGFLSKNVEIAEWCCRLFSKFGFEFANRDLLQHAWEWFVSQSGGLHACILCLKRHTDLADRIIPVLVQYARYNMTELFTINMKNLCSNDNEYLFTVHELLRPLIATHKEELLTSGIIDAWLDFSVKAADSDPHNPKDTVIPALCNYIRNVTSH